MSDWKLSGTENPRSGEVHTWITRDGQYADLEDVVSELIDQQGTIERLRADNHRLRGLLETAVDAWECGQSVIDRHCVLLTDFRGACLSQAWHDEAKQAGGDHE